MDWHFPQNCSILPLPLPLTGSLPCLSHLACIRVERVAELIGCGRFDTLNVGPLLRSEEENVHAFQF